MGVPAKPYRVSVRRSGVSGLGLFAESEFRKGQIICEYSGRMVKADGDVDNKYLFEINRKWMLDGSPRYNIGRYANHSCRPNAESDVSQSKRVWLHARRRIKPGEEIVYDYGKEYIDAYLKRCKCSACRKRKRNGQRKNGAR